MVYFLKGDTQIIGQMMDLNLLQANQIYQLEQFAYDREGTDTTVKVQFNVFYRIQPSNYKVIQYTSWENLVLKVNGIQLVDFGFIKTSSKNSVATADGLLYKQQMHRFFESWGANHFLQIDVSLILICSYSFIKFYNSNNLIELQTSELIQKQIEENYFIVENNLLLITSGKIVKFSYNILKDQVDIFSKSQNFVNFKDYTMFSYQDLDYFSSKNGKLVVLTSSKYSGYYYIWDSNLLFGICPNYCDQCQSDNVKICLKCQDNYFIQFNYKCDLTCPDTSIIDLKESRCKCDDNSTLINNSCICNQMFFQLKNQCIPCSSNCMYCKDQTICNKCLQGFYLFPDQTCGFCDVQNGYFIQDDKCIKCNQSCSSCSGKQESQCTKCNTNMGFFQFPDLTCKECNIIDGYFIDGDKCFKCHKSCQTCVGEKQNQCQKCDSGLGLYLLSDNTCRKCDTNNGYFIDGGNCISCYKSCKTCFGAKNDQCQECYENYQINKNICYQFQLSIESKEFPQSKVESIQKLSQSTSSALVISSSIMNSFQSIGSNSSFGILISSLTIQKLTYLYILNILLPLQIGSVLEILSVNVAEYSSHIEKISYTFLVNVQFVQLIQPIYMIIILSVSVYDLIRKRMVSRVLQQQDSQIDVDNFNSLNLTNINQELVNQKNVSLRIVQIFKKSKKSDSEYQDQKIKNTQYKID
ncbi:hypothetical protein ABPG74_019670 [Tetrahymena malaccensis]